MKTLSPNLRPFVGTSAGHRAPREARAAVTDAGRRHKAARRRRLLTLAEASELLWRFNAAILLNDVHVDDEPMVPPNGDYDLRENDFERLIDLAEANPMCDQRKESGWHLSVNRGGVVAGVGLRCSFPSYYDAHRDYLLVFRVPDKEQKKTPGQ